MKNLKFIVSIAALILLAFMVVFYATSVKNHTIELKESFYAKQKTIQTAHDNMWKTIQQKYDVSTSYKDGFIQSVDAVVQGRQGGSLIKSVQENMPGLSPELYKEVLATIEGKRDMLKREMDTQIDIAREYNAYVQKFPQNLFCDSTRLEPKLITSGKTNEAWESGEDNDVSFGK